MASPPDHSQRNRRLFELVVLLTPIFLILLSILFPFPPLLNIGWVLGGIDWSLEYFYYLIMVDNSKRKRFLKFVGLFSLPIFPVLIICSGNVIFDTTQSVIGWILGSIIWGIYLIAFFILITPIIIEYKSRQEAKKQRKEYERKIAKYKREHPYRYKLQKFFNFLFTKMGIFVDNEE